MLQFERTSRPHDRDHVEALGALTRPSLRCERRRGAINALALLRIDRLARQPEAVVGASLHFNEYDRPAVDGDQVNLATCRAKVSRDYPIPSPAQMARRQPLSGPSQPQLRA